MLWVKYILLDYVRLSSVHRLLVQDHQSASSWAAPAGFLNWGWQAGCDFVGKTCLDYAAANPAQQYFCTREQYADTVNTVCTFDGLARAKCEDAQFADGCTMKVSCRNM
jgi:hypothetical protein